MLKLFSQTRLFFEQVLFFFTLFENLDSPETVDYRTISFSHLSQLVGQFQPRRVSGKLQTPASAVAVKLFSSFA